MKHFTLLRRSGYAFATLGLLCAAVIAAGAWRSSAFGKDEKAEGRRKYAARIRDGVGREVELARGDSPGQIRREVNSATEFIERRSGVSVGEATKNRLVALEESVRSGGARRLTVAAFSAALSATVLERFASLTDQDIAHMDDTLRGFNAPGVPEQFGNLWDVANDRESDAAEAGFTPLQAFLVAYSLVSNDALDYSQANLSKWMNLRRETRTEDPGRPFPSPDGHRAYGVNGYLFSSPLDLFFDERAVNRLLDRVEKGGGA